LADANATGRIRVALDHLLAAAEAVRLASDISGDAQQTIRKAGFAPSDIQANWRATNMLVHAALTNLDTEVRAIEGLLRAMLRSR
jgi:hypothetical protein